MPLTAIQKQHGPFAIVDDVCGKATVMVWATVEDRVHLVKKSTDADWLQAVIRDRDMQASVRIAAERRLRWVKKAIAGLKAQVAS